jgi:CheY-like chemotaxis protein
MSTIQTVLLVEDYVPLQERIKILLHDHFGEQTKVHVAGTIIQAEIMISIHKKEIDLILMDTNLGGGITTFFLTEGIRKQHQFQGPIVATSTDNRNHAEMLHRGCTHACLKGEIVEFLREHFRVSQ